MKFLEQRNQDEKEAIIQVGKIAETHDILVNFVSAVDKKLNEMVEWKIYKSKYQAWNSVAPKYAEKWVKSNDYAVIGIVDAVCNDFDGGTTLLDYKTSKRYGPYLPEDYYRQLIIYAFLYTLEMGDMPNFVGVNYLRFDDTFFVKVNQGVLDEAKETIKSCEFEKLKKMEEKKGFNEAAFKKDKSERIKFFNLGLENNYKNLLNTNLISQMNELYKQKLLKFNYEL